MKLHGNVIGNVIKKETWAWHILSSGEKKLLSKLFQTIVINKLS